MLSLPFTLIMQTIGEKGEEGEKARDETEGRAGRSQAVLLKGCKQRHMDGEGRLFEGGEVTIFASLLIFLPDIHT